MTSSKVLPTSSHLSMCIGIFFGFGSAYVLLAIYTVLVHRYTYSNEQRLLTSNTPELPLTSRDPYFKNKLPGSGVIARVHEGIGNQLHHYACTYALARDLNRPLYNFVVSSRLSLDRKFLPGQRDYALDKFQIPMHNLINESTIIDKQAVTYINDSQLLFRTYSTDNSFLELDGESYCQAEAFWVHYKDEILAMFQLKPEVVHQFSSYVVSLGKEIDSSKNSVAVHVRRGDFRGAWTLPITYQRESIIRISEMLYKHKELNSDELSPKYFIFSDDIDYCKDSLADLAKEHHLVFVSSSSKNVNRTTSLEDFFLMTRCKHFIVPNSTFGWWAAYLGTHKGGNGTSKSPNRDSIVIASGNRPGYWDSSGKDKEKLMFYKYVIHGLLLFPNGWIIHHPPN